MPHGDAGSACDTVPGVPMATIGCTIGGAHMVRSRCMTTHGIATPHSPGTTPWDVAVLVAAKILGACAATTITAVSEPPPHRARYSAVSLEAEGGD
jgi:hypothetical protein